MKHRVQSFTDPLTQKYRPWVLSMCTQFKIKREDGLHEARLHEWEIQQEWRRKNKSKDLFGMERYFYKTLRYRLLDQIKPGGWWARHITSHPDLVEVESLIVSRSFSELGYDYLTQHVSYMLALIDTVAMEIFLAKLDDADSSWKQLHKDRFSYMTEYSFYGYVKDIEDATAEATALYKEQPWIVSLLR